MCNATFMTLRGLDEHVARGKHKEGTIQPYPTRVAAGRATALRLRTTAGAGGQGAAVRDGWQQQGARRDDAASCR